jgi:hypothetical protein
MSDSDSITLRTPLPAPALDELTPVEQVRDQLPMGREVQDQFIAAARSHYLDEAGMDDLQLFNSLLGYVHRLPHSQDLEDTRTLQEAIRGFVWDLTQPLRTAEEGVQTLEQRVHAELKDHPIMILALADFKDDPETSEHMVKDYLAVCDSLTRDIEAVRRNILLAKRLFVDRDGFIIDMRSRLHDLRNVVLGQTTPAECILRYANDIQRRTWIEGLKAYFDESLKLIPYLKRIYAQANVRIIPPDEEITLPEPFVMRNIARHWIRNSLDKGATAVEVELKPYGDDMYVFSVMDNVPGGFPQSVRARLGKEQIIHHEGYEGGSGFEIICKHLAPQLGPGTRIVIETPLDGGNGSRVSVAFPRALPEDKPAPPGNGLANYRSQPAAITFVEMDTPDSWADRARHNPAIREYYSRTFTSALLFERIRAGGLSVYSNTPFRGPFSVKFNMVPRIG